MKKTLKILSLKEYPILEQLRLEEAILRADTDNWCILNEGSSPAIVMGISGKVSEHLNQSIHSQRPIPVIKRFSGGGTVIVDQNTCFFTLICNEAAVKVPCYPRPIMDWNANLYRPWLPQNFNLIDNDYVLGNHKFGGNAQYITKKRWLHHSSLLWDYEVKNMSYLLPPPRMPSYRQKRSHEDFLCRLMDHVSKKEDLFTQLLAQLQNHFELISVTQHTAEEILLRNHRKATEIIHI
jgi:lipoate-protein ligase A